MLTSFLPTWLYNDQKIFELELDNYSKNYWHPLIFIGEIKGIDIEDTTFSLESFNEYNSIISEKKIKTKIN